MKDLREIVQELKFCPKEHGNKLTLGFLDGVISIYSLEGITYGSPKPELIMTFEASPFKISSFSFCKNDSEPPLFAIGFSFHVIIFNIFDMFDSFILKSE